MQDTGCYVTIVPATTPAQAVLDLNPTDVLPSNGPGDPSVCDYAIAAIQVFWRDEFISLMQGEFCAR